MLRSILQYVQAAISILLILAILVQNRSSGLSSAMGGAEFQVTKRGAEKVVYQATIVLAVLFVLTSLAFIFVR